MAIALVQSAEGLSLTAVTSPAFSAATTTGNLVVLTFASDDYNGTPDTGWTQSTGMEQQSFHGGYLWWRISAGETSFQYTIGSAVRSAWTLTEWSGCDASPYDISAGQFTSTSGTSYTTPSITPTSGNRVLIAAMQFQSGNTQGTSVDLTGWLNSFTHAITSATSSTNPSEATGVGYQLVTANGSTSYSSGADTTATPAWTPQSRSGLIIAFKEAAAGGDTLFGSQEIRFI